MLAATSYSVAEDAPDVVRYQLDNVLEVVLSPVASAGSTAARIEDIVDLELADVQDMANSLAVTDRSIIVIAGDPASIVPQLAEIGISDVTVVPADE